MATTYKFIVTDTVVEDNTTTKVLWDYEGTADNGVVGLTIGSTNVNIVDATDEQLLSAVENSFTEEQLLELQEPINQQIEGFREV